MISLHQHHFHKHSSSPLVTHPNQKLPPNMFGLFKKDPVKKLERQYLKLMEEAMRIQRSGDIKSYSAKVAEAEEIQKRIDELKGSS